MQLENSKLEKPELLGLKSVSPVTLRMQFIQVASQTLNYFVQIVSKVLLEIGLLLHGGKHSSDVLILQ